MDRELKAQLAEFCQKYHITKLLRYTNPLRDHCRTESELDLIADFEEGREPGYIRLVGMEYELALILDVGYVYLDGPNDDGLLFPSQELNDAAAVAEPFYPA